MSPTVLCACLRRAGLVGPWMIGAVKTRYGGFTIPMVIMTVVNSVSVIYWGILTKFLPCKSSAKKHGARQLVSPAHPC